MKALPHQLPRIRRKRSDDLPGVTSTARLDRRTKNLATRLCPGDIAIIDHADLDRTGADALIGRQVGAVVNAARSISGRYPNRGPQLLLEAGIPLIDDVGPEVFDRVQEGQCVRLDGDTLYAGEEAVAKGRRQDQDSVTSAMTEAKSSVAADRYREDIATLRSYIRECKPVMVGVDGGADALLEAGYRPDLIVGDMDSVSDRALNCGAEIVVHAYPDGRAPGLPRVQGLGLDAVLCPAPGTSEDIALLLADEKGASLIVAVGRHDTLVEFLDKGRSGMASTFLTRLRVDDKIVDAKGVSRLYRSRVSATAIIPLVLAAAVTVLVAMVALTAGQIFFRYIGTELETFWYWLTGLF